MRGALFYYSSAFEANDSLVLLCVGGFLDPFPDFLGPTLVDFLYILPLTVGVYYGSSPSIYLMLKLFFEQITGIDYLDYC